MSDLVDKEAKNKEDKEEVEEVFKFKLAYSFIKGRQLNLFLTRYFSPPSIPKFSSLILSQPFLLAI